MSLALIFACLWVLVAALVAFMPMKIQMIVGLPLLIAALGIIGWIGARHGVGLAAIGVFAVISMFRKPLVYYWRKLINKNEGDA